MMNFRMASPEVLIDINQCRDLAGITKHGDRVTIGALTRHRDTGASDIIAEHLPLLSEAVPHIAYMAVRNRGTFGGSVALADPAAEIPACAVLLEAVFVLGSKSEMRRVPASEFFQGYYATTLRADEIVLAAEIPARQSNEIFVLHELSRQQGHFAIAGVAGRARVVNSALQQVRMVAFGISDQPIGLRAASDLIEQSCGRDVIPGDIKKAILEDVQPEAVGEYTSDMKAHLAAVLVGRAVNDMRSRAAAFDDQDG